MIDEAILPSVREPGPDRWRRWWLAALVLAFVTAAGFSIGRGMKPREQVAAPSAYPSAPVLEATSLPRAAPPPSATPPPPITNVAAGRLQMPGKVPTHGSGTFRYAMGRGPVLGAKGPLRRFRVAVEKESGEDAEAFAAQVQATLGDPRSWAGGGVVRLQMVAGADPADFTVFLATRDTAGEMCLRGGTNIRISGVPYTSCRATGRVIINLDRWRLSAKPYLYAKVPLAVYRQYVINHEVGHELGHRHEGCPRAGGPAPVMVQQTLAARGCVPNAWPRRGNRFLTGPTM